MSNSSERLGTRAANAAKWSILTQLIAKLISPITTMILARLLTPDAFGIVATAAMIVSLSELVSDAGFQKYLIQHGFKNANELNLAANVAFWTNLAIALVLVGLIGLFQDPLAHFAGSDGAGMVLFISSFSLPLRSLISVQTALYQRDLSFHVLFSAGVASSILVLFVSVPAAYLGADYWSLVAGTLASNILLAIWLSIKSPWRPHFEYSISELKEMFSFGIWILLESFGTWLNVWAGVFVLGTLLNSYDVGLFKTSTNICASVMGVFTAAILPIVFSSLSKVHNDRNAFVRIFMKMQQYLALCTLPVGAWIFIYRDLFTLIVLGDQWLSTSFFIGFWMLAGCIGIPFGYMCSEAYRAIGKPSLCAIVQFVYLIPYLSTLYLSATQGYDAISFWLPISRLTLPIINLIVMKLSIGISPLSMLMNLRYYFIATLVSLAPGLVILYYPSDALVMATTAFISIAVYIIMMLANKHSKGLIEDLIRRLRKAG